MKRLTVAVLCVAVAVSTLACGGKKSESKADKPNGKPVSRTQKWIAKLADNMHAQEALEKLRELNDPAAIEPMVSDWAKYGYTKQMLATIISIARQEPGKKTYWDRALPSLKVAVQRLLAKLDDDDRLDVAVLALHALGEAHLPDAVFPLIDVVTKTEELDRSHRAQAAREAAILGLGSYATPEAVRTLVGVLELSPKKHDVKMFSAAADAMSRIALSDKGRAKLISAIKPLIKTMYKVPPAFQAVRAALVAIGPVAIRALIQVFKQESDELLEWATKHNFNYKCVPTGWGPELQCRAMAEIQYRAAEVLGDARAASALPFLIDTLADEPRPALYDPSKPSTPLTQHHAVLGAIAKIGNGKVEGKTVAERLAAYWRTNKYPALQGVAIRVYASLATSTKHLAQLAGLYVGAKDRIAAPAAAIAYGLLAKKGTPLKPFDTMINRYRKRRATALTQADKFRAAGKRHQSQAAGALASQALELQRESEYALIQATIGMRCGDDLSCYATLSAVGQLKPKVLALLIAKGLARAEAKEPVVIQRLACTVYEMKQWSKAELASFELPADPCFHLGKNYKPVYWTDKQLRQAANVAAERAFVELARRAPQANPQVDKLLKNFDVYTPALREMAITAIYRNSAKPCTKCAKRIIELLRREEGRNGMVRRNRESHKTGTQGFIADAKVWRGLFSWAQ